MHTCTHAHMHTHAQRQKMVGVVRGDRVLGEGCNEALDNRGIVLVAPVVEERRQSRSHHLGHIVEIVGHSLGHVRRGRWTQRSARVSYSTGRRDRGAKEWTKCAGRISTGLLDLGRSLRCVVVAGESLVASAGATDFSLPQPPSLSGDVSSLSCVVWCGVVWCGVVWCGVVWCGVEMKDKRNRLVTRVNARTRERWGANGCT